MGVGLPLGFFTAARRGRWEDYAGSFLAVLAVCVPGFVVAPLLILVFAIKLKWLPGRAVGIAVAHDFAADCARPFLPGKDRAAVSRRHVERHAIRIRHRRPRQGPGRKPLLFKHAVRIAVLPVVSYSGPMLADLLTGSFVIENIFKSPASACFSSTAR
jgi:ABC-type dipeptide/oligopeptide/nickel transport system permease component